MKALHDSTGGEAAAAPVPASAPVKRVRRHSTMAWIGMAIVGFWVLMAILGPSISPYDATAIVDTDVFSGMSHKFLLGSDYLGRDMLSRILFGTRATIGLALAATVLASATGTAVALFAAFSGGWRDAVISRALDALISIPSKMFALMMVATFGSSMLLLVVTAAITYMPGAYRIARSLAVNVQAMEYVQAARARGEGVWYIMTTEMLPNMIRPVLADFGLRFVYVVLLLSGLSFLSLGVQPPDADWGSLVRENISGLGEGALAVIMPALAIASLTIGVNLLIDNLRGKRAAKE
ncbi:MULTISPECIES: ABC transporter permease [Herbaspirillum]|uniref:Dipeptide/oligopeptide/nickel ABC transporter permease n=1 Tax=Herbaspirillum frisingense GSF30 TaxID=864073 RepID=A0AAI9IE03_9BURK|nr:MULTISPECIES: ABC transporter permease [Herbaspirillum]EOA04379.1 dipeptide/oligopeptide/nickel ABC transporter permease [Herbaspirillum frisingense GSF30]MCI1012879.1 ABC transporter permease [Herbaspirillum sp. C7C2]QNB06300.1 ABC transporter permease [Herbaspirillum frisingense]UIN22469.1 ABC transporter permease [Herbaspirillum frisingense]